MRDHSDSQSNLAELTFHFSNPITLKVLLYNSLSLENILSNDLWELMQYAYIYYKFGKYY